MLHAAALEFPHPAGGLKRIVAPPPADFEALARHAGARPARLRSNPVRSAFMRPRHLLLAAVLALGACASRADGLPAGERTRRGGLCGDPDRERPLARELPRRRRGQRPARGQTWRCSARRS